jgi:hypothetical protein
MLALVFVVVGGVLVYGGLALITNRHGATEWWMDYAWNMRDRFGRAGAPITYNTPRTRALGRAAVIIGLLFAITGLSQLLTP